MALSPLYSRTLATPLMYSVVTGIFLLLTVGKLDFDRSPVDRKVGSGNFGNAADPLPVEVVGDVQTTVRPADLVEEVLDDLDLTVRGLRTFLLQRRHQVERVRDVLVADVDPHPRLRVRTGDAAGEAVRVALLEVHRLVVQVSGCVRVVHGGRIQPHLLHGSYRQFKVQSSTGSTAEILRYNAVVVTNPRL